MRVPEIARTSRWRRLLYWAGAAVAFLAVVGASVLVGFEVRVRQVFPVQLLSAIDRKLDQLVFSRLNEQAVIETALVRLHREDGVVSEGPLDLRLQWGGGLTSFGEDVLVLPYGGRVYAARSPQTIHETRILAPENNRAAYVKDYQALGSDPAFDTPQGRGLDYLRYNDIQYYDTTAGRGLAVSYTEYHPQQRCVTSTLATLAIDPAVRSVDDVRAAPEDWKVLFRSEPCLPFKSKNVAMEGHMAGGRMVLEVPSTIYTAIGDYGFDSVRSNGTPLAQDPTTDYGKVLSIDLVTGEKRALSSGLRNPQGIARARDGRIFVTDHGARGGDEVNLVAPGANFGWPKESYGTLYSGQRLPDALTLGRHKRFDPPVLAWLPSVAVSGLAVVEGFHDAWDGDLLVSAMVDQSVYRVRLRGDRAVYSERISIGSRVRDVHQHTDGRIVLWTDNHELVFLRAEDLRDEADHLQQYLAAAPPSPEMRSRLESAVASCSECHSFSPGQHTRSPGLNRIYGDPIGATAFQGYSESLKRRGGRWTAESLEAYLTAPETFAPGSVMPNQRIDPPLAKEIIAYLKYLDGEL